ncbi:MAG: FmdB family zinc ribbon protein [Desulfobaccales bacterium]|jgi:putative FmdB family regulatory protein
MPIYEYQCSACGHIVEKWQKLSEEPLTVCAACGGPLHKLISNCAFHLKGSGWYVTDYAGSRANSATSDAGKDKAGDSSPAAADSGSTSVK